ncbi:MAG: phage tail protein [Brevundimonas sp.]|nr:MAG: phage tail protein [Brevundimonas sp.]
MEVYMGSIQPFAFQWAPRGWMVCSGQLLGVSQYSALFSLLGVAYGGNGQQTFGLPNLNGRTITGQGTSTTGASYVMGEMAGSEQITLMQTQMPQHSHGLMGTTAAATTNTPGSSVMLAAANGSDPTSGDTVNVQVYGPAPANTALAPNAIGVAGGSQPFSVMQPFLVVNYCIAIQGLYPSRN